MNLFKSAIVISMLVLLSACSPHTEESHLSPSSEAELLQIQAFKTKSGLNRLKAWEQLQPSLTNRLVAVPRNKPALRTFFEQWLGPSEDPALERSEAAVVSPLSPEPNRDNIFAYQLSYEDYFSEDLVVDFRNPQHVTIGILRGYSPPDKKSQHDEVSSAEKQIAAELNATEINLGGGSLDGSAKPGYWVRLGGANLNEAAVQKAAMLSTLVSLQLRGTNVTDRWLAPLAKHKYLSSLELYSTSITDDGLTNLAGLSALKWLTITDAGSLTKDGLNALRTALPGCEIEIREK